MTGQQLTPEQIASCEEAHREDKALDERIARWEREEEFRQEMQAEYDEQWPSLDDVQMREV